MAQIPTPRSYSEILGDMIDAFLSRYGLRALKIGSPVLSMFESAAQSQLRSSEDIFTLLEATSLDQAKGVALDRIGADESVLRETENPASGVVTIGDSSFNKISSKIFQGTPAPIIGSVKINVVDASAYPASGSVYLGRSTSNYEGPLAYTSILPPGSGGGRSGGNYWTLVLSTGTLKFHNLGETVILAQGGNRDILPGVIVQTPQGNAVDATQFRVLYKATIPDGENSISGVTVVALKPGTTGNVADGAINSFSSNPFAGATVTNPQPFTNGIPSETDDSYRERIRQARASRVRGTALALQTFAIGVSSSAENKRVLTASVVAQSGQPTALYVDDGTGYEMSSSGIAIESFMDSATGGENFFKVSAPRPITKAFVLSTEAAPFTLGAGMQWAFTVGGVTTTHTISDDGSFVSIGNATAYEWVASVNANPALNWSARAYANGTKVAVFAKADTSESIQYNKAAVTIDGNAFTGFGLGRVDTMRLYKNDRLLNKDGALATITSNSSATWASLGPTEDLQLAVDGTPLTNLVGGTYTFTAQDFINASTGYASVGANSPAAWAAVFNYRIPGITATVVNGLITIASNLGASSRAQLNVAGGSLVTKGMFNLTLTPVVGANSDYILDRNTGELKLTTPLALNDRLAAGSVNTRAFLESTAFNTVTVSAAGAHLWFAADASAYIVPQGLTASTPITFSASSPAWGKRERATAGSAIFSNVKVGDWAIFWDPAAPADLLDRAFRVADVDAGGTWFEIERATATIPGGPVTLASGGLSVVRTTAQLQKVTVPAGANYTASTIAPIFDQYLVGAQATTYRTTAMRVNTSTFSDVNGDIALVAADADGALLGLTPASATKNITGHLASIESANGELGTPDFHQVWTTTASAIGAQPQVDWTADTVYAAPHADSQLVGLRPMPDDRTLAGRRYGENNGANSTLSSVASAGGHLFNLNLRSLPYETFLHGRSYFAAPYRLASDDSATFLLDGDTDSKRFTVPMWRHLATVGGVYGSTNTFKDADNGSRSLAIGFGAGTGFDFNDYAVFMPARGKTDAASLTKAILWRYFRLGPEGNFAQVQYQNPIAANQPVGFTVDNTSGGSKTNIGITLSSGAERTGYSIRSTTYLGQAATGLASGLGSFMFVLGLLISSATVSGGNLTDLTLTMPSGITDHGLQIGDIVWVNSTNGFVASGAKTITARTATTISYASTDTNGVYANIGDVSKDSAGRATLSGGNQASGDFFYLGSGFGSRLFTQSMYTTFNLSQWSGNAPYSGATSGTLSWVQIADTTQFHIIANPAQTSSAFVTAFNAAIAGNKLCPLANATLVSDGTGIIDRSSDETAVASPTWVPLTDGINYVQTTTVPGTTAGDYQLAFKNTITAALATNSDWANETVRLVPRTAKNIVDWLNEPTVSGLFSAADVERSSNAHKVQIASLTPGSSGSVQVQGGTANGVTAAVVGSSSLASSQMVSTIAASDAAGMMGYQWVSVNNAETLPKSVFTSATTLQAITNSGLNSTIQIGTTTFFTRPSAAQTTGVLVAIEKQGAFWAITDTGLGAAMNIGTLAEGDYIKLAVSGSPTYAGVAGSEAVSNVNTGNTGIFRVVRVLSAPDVGGDTVWIENASGVAQELAEVALDYFTADSVMPGDYLSISTSLWDGAASNKGRYQVYSVGDNGSGAWSNASYVTVVGTLSPVGIPTAALGSNYLQVQLVEGTPARYIKQILNIAPNQLSSSLYDVKFTTNKAYAKISAAAGSVMTVLDKLGFGTGVAVGVDGYQHTTGLIAEVSKVIQGDPSDTATYPGVASAGATVNILGPLVKRITVTLSIRVRSGAPTEDIKARVKSAVAAVINKTGIGEAIALSDLTNAASKVSGVISAVMVKPAASAGADLISVQPYEKPLVLNVDTDVQVSLAGS